MNRKELTKSYSQTVQIEQYEPVKSSVTQTVELEDGDDVDEISDQLQEENVAIVSRDIAARIAQKEMSDDVDE